ncbi:MAG: hypothetical protein WD377_01835 [Nitriliruptoraceae bacterium]
MSTYDTPSPADLEQLLARAASIDTADADGACELAGDIRQVLTQLADAGTIAPHLRAAPGDPFIVVVRLLVRATRRAAASTFAATALAFGA